MSTRIAAILLWALLAMIPPAQAADPFRVFAAGSLTDAFTEMEHLFAETTGASASPTFGPSGLLRERIEHGEPADVFASADMDQPRILAREQSGRYVEMFTRNRLCVLGRAKLGLNPDNLLDKLLDPNIRIATSTPHADPAGDYTWAVFARAEALHSGAQKILEAKALPLFGGPNTPPLVPGRGAVQGIFLADRADIAFSYCSGSAAVMRDVPELTSVTLPPALTVGPSYGLIVLTDNPLAARFALFVLSEQGQSILARHGFDPIGLAGQ
jgi:ABC-type molybdate transport system substrate-binding protein